MRQEKLGGTTEECYERRKECTTEYVPLDLENKLERRVINLFKGRIHFHQADCNMKSHVIQAKLKQAEANI